LAKYQKLSTAPPEYPPPDLRPQVAEGEEWDGVFEADLTPDEERAVVAAGWVERAEEGKATKEGGKK